MEETGVANVTDPLGPSWPRGGLPRPPGPGALVAGEAYRAEPGTADAGGRAEATLGEICVAPRAEWGAYTKPAAS